MCCPTRKRVFNWDKSVLTVYAKPLSLTKNAEIVMSYQSGSSEAGSLYLVQKPQKIDIPIGVYVNTEIDANRAVSLDFQWLQSDTFITTITECTGISDGEYYLAWVGRSNNSHPKIRFPESTGGLKMKDTICVAVGLVGGFLLPFLAAGTPPW